MKFTSRCCASLTFPVDMSTLSAAEEVHMPDSRSTPRKIVGFSMSPELAAEVKQEAAKRGVSLRKLFEEMWELYKKSTK